MIATHDRKVPLRVGKLTLLDVFDPSAIHANWNFMLRFAGNRTGVATDASPVVYDKTKVGYHPAVHQSQISGRKDAG